MLFRSAKTENIDLVVILSGVIAAIIWNLITWWKGIPSSSSHTLIGGFAGAAIAHAGFNVVNWYKPGEHGSLPSGVLVVIAFIVFSLMIYSFKWPIILPFHIFIIFVLILFFFSQRIVINDGNITGPSAYGKRRQRIKIPHNEAEVFFEKGRFGFGQIVIRHKHSSKQILVPYLYFAGMTIKEMKQILHS